MADLSYGTLVSRALRLRCPRCGKGALFKNFLFMHERCPECLLKYERAPGYFLGSIYLNYGVMAILMVGLYMLIHFGYGYSNEALTPFFVIGCVVLPLFFFRYARAWWLAMDCYCDPTGFGLHATPENSKQNGAP